MRLSDIATEEEREAFRQRRKFEVIRRDVPMCTTASDWLKARWTTRKRKPKVVAKPHLFHAELES